MSVDVRRAAAVAAAALDSANGVEEVANALWCILGDVSFQLATSWSELKGTEEATYPQHDILDGKPVLQRAGDKLDQLEMKIVFDSSYCDPAQGLADLRALKNAAEPQALVLGDGTWKGEFVITKIEIEVKNTHGDGVPTRLECAVSLLEHVPRPRPAVHPAPRAVSRGGKKPAQAQTVTTEMVGNVDGYQQSFIRK